MLKCKDVVARADDYVDRCLSWRERLAMGWHLVQCAYCRLYVAQLRLLVKALRGYGKPASAEVVEKIMRRIEADEPRH